MRGKDSKHAQVHATIKDGLSIKITRMPITTSTAIKLDLVGNNKATRKKQKLKGTWGYKK